MLLDWKELLGLGTVLLAFLCYVPYVWGILKGTVKPHIHTHFVWFIITGLSFFASWTSGGGAGSWNLGVSSLLILLVVILSLKYGTKNITRSDRLYTLAALLCVIPWLILKDPTISIILAVFIEALSFIPTYRKTWEEPKTESELSWALNTLKHFLGFIALESLSVATYLYPLAMVLLNGALTIEIRYRVWMMSKLNDSKDN